MTGAKVRIVVIKNPCPRFPTKSKRHSDGLRINLRLYFPIPIARGPDRTWRPHQIFLVMYMTVRGIFQSDLTPVLLT